MLSLTLVRGAFTTTATYGMLSRTGAAAFAVTVERERDNNRPSKGDKAGACIPPGTYTCRRVQSPKFGDTFEITNVPNRSHILFHAGNLSSDSRGCVIIGDTFDPVNGVDGVTQSRDAMKEFLNMTKDIDSFELTIVDAL